MNASKANPACLAARIAKENGQDVLVREIGAVTTYACLWCQYDNIELSNQRVTKDGRTVMWGVKHNTQSLDLIVVHESSWHSEEQAVKRLLNITASEEHEMDFVMNVLEIAPSRVIEDLAMFVYGDEFDNGVTSSEVVSWLLLY